MGMYTEIYVNVDLKKETPDEIIQVLKAMCGQLDREKENEVFENLPDRWLGLFYNGSYYVPSTSCRFLRFDNISNRWSLLGKGISRTMGKKSKPSSNGSCPGYERLRVSLSGTNDTKKT